MDNVSHFDEKLACVILNYNDADTTISLVELIKDYEIIDYIIIVDNRSTDSSLEKLVKFQNKKIKVISSTKNGGYGYGNNFGIRYAKDNLDVKYILIANPDTKFEEKVVIGLKGLMKKYPDCMITAPECMNGISRVAWKILDIRRYVLESSVVFFHLFGRKAAYSPLELEKNDYLVDVVQGSLLLLDLDKFIKIGMYDEAFFLYEEEIIIGVKAREHYYETRLLPAADYEHIHSATISKSYRSIVKQKRMILNSRLLYLQKYCGVGGVKLVLIKWYFCLVTLEMKCIQSLYKYKKSNIKDKEKRE